MQKKIRVCKGRSCRSFGAERIMNTISKETGLEPGEDNKKYSLDSCACVGYCGSGPNVIINDDHLITHAEEDTIMDEIEKGGKNKKGKEIFIQVKDKLLGI
jgi:NADH:ubiquinone oxidoreductase subunit E